MDHVKLSVRLCGCGDNIRRIQRHIRPKAAHDTLHCYFHDFLRHLWISIICCSGVSLDLQFLSWILLLTILLKDHFQSLSRCWGRRLLCYEYGIHCGSCATAQVWSICSAFRDTCCTLYGARSDSWWCNLLNHHMEMGLFYEVRKIQPSADCYTEADDE